jgi:hypothetical protein
MPVATEYLILYDLFHIKYSTVQYNKVLYPTLKINNCALSLSTIMDVAMLPGLP